MEHAGNESPLVLDGLNGWVRGESYTLHQGEVCIGRSRSCDISLRRCQGYRSADPQTRDNDHDFNTVSRRHVSILVEDTYVTLRDLSSNGTYLDDVPIDNEVRINMSDHNAVVLRLGTREAFILRQLKDEYGTRSTGKLDDSVGTSTYHTQPTDPRPGTNQGLIP
ncbi:MAG: FHA domain-containing protein [Planctomycetota bacterium]|nr:MAG: FHA domain-containing protein [Planctomycetota bacterium]